MPTGWSWSPAPAGPARTYTSNIVAFAEPLGVRTHPAKKKS